MNNIYPSYSVAVRTLGKAREKYMDTLASVDSQTLQPDGIYVYIPFGYSIPEETIRKEKYVFCEKGMVAQRALPYDEIKSDYILFLDDDVSFGQDFVQTLFDELIENDGDCIAPDTFACQKDNFMIKVRNYLGGTRIHHKKNWAFTIRPNAHFSYNNKPKSNVLLTQTAAGPCCLCNKKAYRSINYADERWIDCCRYSMGEDQLFYYKLFRYGFKVLISYDALITHLNAGSGHEDNIERMWHSVAFCRYVIWYRTMYEISQPIWAAIKYNISSIIDSIISIPLVIAQIIKHHSIKVITVPISARREARQYVQSYDYKSYGLFYKK